MHSVLHVHPPSIPSSQYITYTKDAVVVSHYRASLLTASLKKSILNMPKSELQPSKHFIDPREGNVFFLESLN